MQGSVQQGQKPCLPEGVAAVHQLVAAALKSSFKSHLPTRHPLLRETRGKVGVNQRYSNQGQSAGQSGAPASLPSSPTAILKQPLPGEAKGFTVTFLYTHTHTYCSLSPSLPFPVTLPGWFSSSPQTDTLPRSCHTHPNALFCSHYSDSHPC